MSDKPENGLKQELDRRKRINRIKSIIVSFVGIWMLASVILCATLFVKVIHLENNLNKVLQNIEIQKVMDALKQTDTSSMTKEQKKALQELIQSLAL